MLTGEIRSEEETTIVFPFKAWGSQAESVHSNISDGQTVVIVGRLKLDKFKEENQIDVIDIRIA